MEELLLAALRDNQRQAVNLNTDQLFSGRDSQGNFLPDYSPRSVALGKPAGPIRLYDTGDFYNGFFIRAERFPIEIDSRDSKTAQLKIRYGGDIFGLDKEDLREFVRVYVLPGYQKAIRRVILLR